MMTSFCSVLCCFLFFILYAQDFYWDPRPLYSGDSRFPIVASLDGRAASYGELDSVSAERADMAFHTVLRRRFLA